MKITCRICKIQQGEFFTLDSMVIVHCQREHKLLDMYNKCFQLNADLQDALPQVVCLVCFEKLKEFFEFQMIAENSDLEFRKNLPKAFTREVKTEYLGSCYQNPNSEKTIKPEDKVENIEKSYDNDERRIQDDRDNEEQIEDTDILFELYNKNDSCLEKYLKFENNEYEEIIEQENVDKDNNENSSIIALEDTSYDKLETVIPSIEISRIDLATHSDQVQTVMLDTLVEIKKWQCSECGRKHITEEKFKQHRKVHEQSENCYCEICGSQLETLYDYKEHMKTHGSERKFSCEFCDKTFSTRANLKAHIYIHTNLRPFQCEVCGKAFQQKSILKTHMTLHTGKPFECTLCNRRFSRTAHLNIHMRQHNNIRPYRCTQCPSSYMQKSHLDRHISSSHLGVRFQCTVCGKMYTKKPSLNTHMREAHCTKVSLSYNCKICNLDFSKQKGLYYHLKSKHPDYKNSFNYLE